MKYAIINTQCNGQVIDYCETPEQASKLLEAYPQFKLVEISKASKVLVEYTELGGPNGYGHQEPSFETYGSLMSCVRNLYNWMKSEYRAWGPDPRDIRDYFRHCRLYINGNDKSEWLFKQINEINLKTIYV